MLDIVANANWERPIYFTGGSFGDANYLWMKDYLQLDGVCYKLVPIQTKIDPETPYDMGRIDTEKMYEIVTNWDWDNNGSDAIYHDPETRKNSITYRGNLARLVENLLQEGKTQKAKEILDLGMEKMPVDKFGYYTLLEPFISGYYQIGEKERAREIWQKVAKKYQESLQYYSQLGLDRQYQMGEEIITNIERYRSLVDLLLYNQDEQLIEEEAQKFNEYLQLFEHFYEDEEDYNPAQQEEQIDNKQEDLLPDNNLNQLPVDSAQTTPIP